MTTPSDVRPLFIDGVWREGAAGHTSAIIEPATEESIGRVAHATASDVDDAIRAARAAFPRWSAADPEERSHVLRRAAAILARRAEEAAVALTREQGKTVAESRGEFSRAIATLAWNAEAARRALDPRPGGGAGVVRPEPIGVVGAFIPWNYPAVIAARKLGAALAAGCTVVVKGPEEAPNAMVCIVRALEEAGLPAGAVNLLFGDPPAIAARLLDSTFVDGFTFTGSTAVGKQLAQRAALTLKRCVLELGGHAPVLVFADADIDAAIPAIVAYKFECAGQSCNAPSRIYVEEAAYDRFVGQLLAAVGMIRLGNGLEESTTMGPMANARRLGSMERLTSEALSRGSRLLCGGRRAPRRGYFWPPTVLVEVPETAEILSEEPFGPILPVISFKTFESALSQANRNPYGLAAYVFTSSPDTAAAATRQLATGSVGINELRGVSPELAMAGVKDSGYGYEGGQLGIDAFLNLKLVRGRTELL